MRRIRFRQSRALGERLIKEARIAREKAELLPRGRELEDLLKKAHEADVAAHIAEWLNSQGLKAPTKCISEVQKRKGPL
ncbi:hypothetical protein [Bradyrhizobium sp. Ec3.3]|uniref:hypothetical protein n=1 Tax=Bradyrhizobium sp. Ec3.3 TaxID=189753 RepID=UPI0003F994A4|nr:hypothetical protein [Bradyrhizobium sp. Ec3.3]